MMKEISAILSAINIFSVYQNGGLQKGLSFYQLFTSMKKNQEISYHFKALSMFLISPNTLS